MCLVVSMCGHIFLAGLYRIPLSQTIISTFTITTQQGKTPSALNGKNVIVAKPADGHPRLPDGTLDVAITAEHHHFYYGIDIIKA